MDGQQQDLLRILLVTRTFHVYQSRNGPRRLSQGPGGPRFVDMDVLLGNAPARSQVLSGLISRLHQSTKHYIRGLCSVPYACEWLAAMAADRLSVPLLRPSWVSDVAVASVHGFVPFGSSVWIIDADPDNEDDGRLLHAAVVVSSQTVGCRIAGAAVLFERNGHTRADFLARFPDAAFIPLLDLREALILLAKGMFASLVDPRDAARSLQLLDDAASMPRLSKTSFIV